MKRVLSWCAAIPYLLVVRTSKLTSPSSRTSQDFVSGVAEGQVFAFELPTGKAIGELRLFDALAISIRRVSSSAPPHRLDPRHAP